MKLFFLRHADALEGMDDALRPLSLQGEQQARLIGGFLRKAGIVFDAAFTSPLVRARQTAEEVLRLTNSTGTPALQEVAALENQTTPAEFNQWLKILPPAKHVLLVGHAPTLSERVAQLSGIVKPGVIDLPKAGLACVEMDGLRSHRLLALVTPKLLGGVG